MQMIFLICKNKNVEKLYKAILGQKQFFPYRVPQKTLHPTGNDYTVKPSDGEGTKQFSDCVLQHIQAINLCVCVCRSKTRT